jgi:hypothetical protein
MPDFLRARTAQSLNSRTLSVAVESVQHWLPAEKGLRRQNYSVPIHPAGSVRQGQSSGFITVTERGIAPFSSCDFDLGFVCRVFRWFLKSLKMKHMGRQGAVMKSGQCAGNPLEN